MVDGTLSETEAEAGFNESEQEAFDRLTQHVDPNPRRVKRLVNIYRLVRELIRQREKSLEQAGAATSNLPRDPFQIVGWLVRCEQWPYAAHVMLDTLDDSNDLADSASTNDLYEKARAQMTDKAL